MGRFQLSLLPPAGLGYLAQVLEKNDITYEVLDINLGHNFKYLKNKIYEFHPNLIAISMMTFMHKSTYEFIKNIKELDFNLKIVVGGPHISTFRQRVLFDCPEIDYGVVMEGEQTLIELCQGKDISTIKGLIYRQNGQIIFNGKREFIMDLDCLPFPTYAKFNLPRYPTSQIGIVSSRGCPFSCIFCPVNSTIGKVFRYRSPQNIVDELEYWNSHGRREILFLDDNFTLIPERVYQICKLIRKNGLNKLRLKCPNGIRADKVDRALLKEMKESGFVMLAFGVEAGNNRILTNLKKGETIEQIEEAIKNACELGFEVELFFLIGSPGETVNDVRDSVRLAQRYPVYNTKFYNLIPFPETELYSWVTKSASFTEDPQRYLNNISHFINKPCFETSEMSIEERIKMFKYTQKISRKIRRKAYEYRFKRFNPFCKILAFIYTMGFVQRLAVENRLFLKIKKFLKLLLVS